MFFASLISASGGTQVFSINRLHYSELNYIDDFYMVVTYNGTGAVDNFTLTGTFHTASGNIWELDFQGQGGHQSQDAYRKMASFVPMATRDINGNDLEKNLSGSVNGIPIQSYADGDPFAEIFVNFVWQSTTNNPPPGKLRLTIGGDVYDGDDLSELNFINDDLNYIPGSSDAPNIQVEHPLNNPIQSTDDINFGNVTVGQTVTQTLTIRNTGNADLTLNSISKGGAQNGEFAVSYPPGTTVAAGGTKTITVQFTPDATGLRSADIDIETNDPDESLFTVFLFGTGTSSAAPEIKVEQPVGTDVPDNGSRNFGDVGVGSTASMTFTIKNIGQADLALGTATMSGAHASNYSVTNQPAAIVSPGSQTTMTVAFTPSTTGSRTAKVSFINNDSNETPFDINFTGTGVNTGGGVNLVISQPDGWVDKMVFNTTGGQDTDQDTFCETDVIYVSWAIKNIGSQPTQNFVFSDVLIDGQYGAIFTGIEAGWQPGQEWEMQDFEVGQLEPGIYVFQAFVDSYTPVETETNENDNTYTRTITVLEECPGGSEEPEIDIETFEYDPIPDGGTYNFEEVEVGTSKSHTFRIFNRGEAPLTGLFASIDGVHADDYVVTDQPPATLAAGENTTFTVEFTPSQPGFRNASIHVANNDSDENPYDINVTGEGTVPDIAVEIDPGIIQVPLNYTVNYGDVSLGSSKTITYKIRNYGRAPLRNISVSISGANAGDYVVTSHPASIVELLNGATTFSVTFTPGAMADRNATVSIASNDPDENPFTFYLTGRGVKPEISIEQPVGTEIADGGARTFANTRVGQVSEMNFRIRNLGNSPLLILSGHFTGAHINDFSFLGLFGSIAPGGYQDFTVYFEPGAPGNRTATFHIGNNDADENPYDITLNGLGTAPEIAVENAGGTGISDGGSYGFSSVALGSFADHTFTIRNLGTAELTVGSFSESGSHTADFAVVDLPNPTIAPGASSTFTVRFQPQSLGSRTMTLRIANNDLNENPYDINLSGTGIGEPEIDVEQPAFSPVADGGSRSYGNVSIGQTQTLIFTIRNTGNINLTGISAQLSGTHAADFTVMVNPATTVSAGSDTLMSVRFAPGQEGARTALLRIASNDANENPYDITLTGTGVGQPEIALEQPLNSALADGGSRNFGTITLGIPQSLEFTVRNTGTGTLSGINVTFSGGQSTEFQVTTPPPASLVPGGSAQFTVAAAPTAVGVRATTMRIASNDADENPYDVNLTVTGAVPGISIQQPVGTTVSNGGTRDFGTVDALAETSLTFRLINTGAGQLTGISFSLAGDHPTDFAVTGLPVTLSAGQFQDFSVIYSPLAEGARSAQLSITSNAATYVINLTGQAVGEPMIRVKRTIGPVPIVSGGWGFVGEAYLGEDLAFSITIDNIGTSSLSLSNFTLSGVASGDYTITELPQATVAVGGSTAVHLRFTPSAVGNRTATLSFNSTDPDNEIFNALLLGTGANYPQGQIVQETISSATDPVYAMAVQPDGKILISQYYSGFGGSFRTALVRLETDGSIDPSFSCTPNDFVRAIAVLPNGKIMIGGTFTNLGTNGRNYIARLNANGSVDTSFTLKTNNQVTSFAVEPNGDILLGGMFTSATANGFISTPSWITRNRLLRWKANDTLDAFHPNVNGTVDVIALQEDGQVLFGGQFSQVGGVAKPYLARTSSGGVLDSGFSPAPNSYVQTLSVLGSGEIIVGGLFTQIASATRNRLAKLTSAGAIVVIFNPNLNGSPLSSIATAEDRFLLGGNFTTISGFSASHISKRYSTYSGPEPTFIGSANGSVQALAIGSDGITAAGGTFTAMNGSTDYSYAALITGSPVSQDLEVPDPSTIRWMRSGGLPEVTAATFEVSIDGGATYTSLGQGTRITGGWELTGLSLPNSGLIRVWAAVNSGYFNASSGIMQDEVPLNFTLQSQFTAWITDSELTGEDAEMGAIPFDDGVPNILKFAFNIDPSGPADHSPQPEEEFSGLPKIWFGPPEMTILGDGPEEEGMNRLVMEYVRRVHSPDLVYEPQFGDDLTNPALWTTPPTEEIIATDGIWERVRVHDSEIGTPTRYARVRVYEAP